MEEGDMEMNKYYTPKQISWESQYYFWYVCGREELYKKKVSHKYNYNESR